MRGQKLEKCYNRYISNEKRECMKNRKVFQSLTLILQFGLNMIVPIFMCTLFGVWLGERYDIPIVTVPLFIVGALAGFTNIFKMAKKIYGQDGESDRNHAKKTK